MRLTRLRGAVSRSGARQRGPHRAARRPLSRHPPAPRRVRAGAVPAMARHRHRRPEASLACAAVADRAWHAGRHLRDLSGLQPLSGRRVGHRLRGVRGAAPARSRQGRAGRRDGAAPTPAGHPCCREREPGQALAAPVPAARDRGRPGAGAGGSAVRHRAAGQPHHVRLRLGGVEPECHAAADPDRPGGARRAGQGAGERLHRQPADPHGSVPLQLAVVAGARRGGGQGAGRAASRRSPGEAAGKGDADPLAPNTSADGRERNRRTEIVLLRTSRLP